MPLASTVSLPTYRSRLREIAAAEAGDGWLCACAEAGRFLLPSRQLVASLAELFGRLCGTGILPVRAQHGQDARATQPSVLEVCAGRGELADALAAAGVPLVAADADPPPGSPVVQASAAVALRRYRPAVVLGCFVPFDAGVDDAVLACPSVQHYVVLGARIGGCLGSPALWQNPQWKAEPLPRISRWMLTRHDVWLGTPRRAVLRHGEVWHFRRLSESTPEKPPLPLGEGRGEGAPGRPSGVRGETPDVTPLTLFLSQRERGPAAASSRTRSATGFPSRQQ